MSLPIVFVHVVLFEISYYNSSDPSSVGYKKRRIDTAPLALDKTVYVTFDKNLPPAKISKTRTGNVS